MGLRAHDREDVRARVPAAVNVTVDVVQHAPEPDVDSLIEDVDRRFDESIERNFERILGENLRRLT